MDLSVSYSKRKAEEMQECEALNYVYSCPESPDNSWGADSGKNHTSWICLFVVRRGRQEKCKSV